MTQDLDTKVQGFVEWARQNLESLRTQPAAAVADRIGDAILAVDPRLGVEVANQSDDPAREVIVTAFSDPSLFRLVRRLVASVAHFSGWRFVALKPPRGFAFNVSVGANELRAADLKFAPIPEVEAGITLIVPDEDTWTALPDGQCAEELAWLAVETGAGEELAGRLAHVEFAAPSTTRVQRPIHQLTDFLTGLPLS